jgi:hypothetical protein
MSGPKMTPIETNKTVFFDKDGSVLEGGEIYIGQPGTDPRTNAKTVTFRDAGGSEFTAAQPLNTLNGRIVYNGKPIVALVDGEHSMLVINSANVQVDYSRSVNSGSTAPAGIVGFSDLIRVGLTLPAIKLFSVNVGESIRNIGKVTATDSLGANWLVTSASGTPGNDNTIIDFSNGLQGVIVKDNQEFTGTAIGDTIALPTHLTGIVEPPLNASFRYIKLTAGESGAGEYNESVLTGETVTGTAPLLVATAVINLTNSPINGQTVNLINSEGRYIKPGVTSGTVANDKMQQITGSSIHPSLSAHWSGTSFTEVGAFTASGLTGQRSDASGTGSGSRGFTFDSANSPSARTGASTDVKHIQYTYYMRIS